MNCFRPTFWTVSPYLRRSERVIACWLCWPSESIDFFSGDFKSILRGLPPSEKVFAGEFRSFLGLFAGDFGSFLGLFAGDFGSFLGLTTEAAFKSGAKLLVLGRRGLPWALIGGATVFGDFGGLLGLSSKLESEINLFAGVNLLDVRRGLSYRQEVPGLFDGVFNPCEEAIWAPSGEVQCKPSGEDFSNKDSDDGRKRGLLVVPGEFGLIGADAIVSSLPDEVLWRFRLSRLRYLVYTVQTSACNWKPKGNSSEK